MDRILLEAAYNIEVASNPEKAWDCFVGTLARINLNKVIYITRSDAAPPDWFVRSTLPDQWPLAETKRPAFSEPFVTYCCATFEPTKLGQDFIELHEHYIDDYTRTYVQSMARFNWTSGVGIPCSLKGSGRYGGFILGNGMTRHDFERGVVPKLDDLRTLCLIASKRFEAWRQGALVTRAPRPLSPRETQVMVLLSQGLRPKRIASELGLKETSIRLYLKNARSKLGASNNQEVILAFARLRDLGA